MKEITETVEQEIRLAHATEQTEAWAAYWLEAKSPERKTIAEQFMAWLWALPDPQVAEQSRHHFRRLLGLEG